MNPERFAKAFTPLAGLAALALAGCAFDRQGQARGVPLDQLDLTGPPPRGVALAGPDKVVVREGTQFAVTVEGDAESAAALRFALADGTLEVGRRPGGSHAPAVTITVTMPAPRKLALAGSGSIESERLSGAAEVSIAGSGWIATPSVDAEDLQVSIGGSGSYIAAGRAGHLELSIGGSGSARMDDLWVEMAEVSLAGSGSAAVSSDGEVDASIAGSGHVTVHGKARCKLSAVGSGTLQCDGPVDRGD